MELKHILMTDYDPIKDEASITFIAPNGEHRNLWITRTTFMRLMGVEVWDKEKYGDPFKLQADLQTVAKRVLPKGDALKKWFEEESNRLLEIKAKGL